MRILSENCYRGRIAQHGFLGKGACSPLPEGPLEGRRGENEDTLHLDCQGHPLPEASGEMGEMVASIRAAEKLDRQHLDLASGVVAGAGRVRLADHASSPLLHSADLEKPLELLAVEAKQEPHPHLLGGHITLEIWEHGARYVSEARVGTSDLHEEIHHSGSDGLATAVNGLLLKPSHVLGHTALSAGMQAATAAMGLGSGVLGATLLRTGVRDVRDGLREKDAEHTLEGVGALLVGTRSVAAGVVSFGHLFHYAGSGLVALSQSALEPLGIAHGILDSGFGIHDIISGVRDKKSCRIGEGVLGVGMGVSLIAAAAGGGIPALLVAGAFLTGKVVHSLCNRDHSENKEHEEASPGPEHEIGKP